MHVQVQASRRMLSLALGLGPRGIDALSEDEIESLLCGELYRRFPKYAPNIDGNDDEIAWGISRKRKQSILTAPGRSAQA